MGKHSLSLGHVSTYQTKYLQNYLILQRCEFSIVDNSKIYYDRRVHYGKVIWARVKMYFGSVQSTV